MKKYVNPEIEFNMILSKDVITASGETYTKTGYTSGGGAGNTAIDIEDFML